ncbi:extracellular solute-binding protein [Propioniciclava coleopterorum]|uniref:Extracellular solute-binding protein n=1 Tax=Propioniciclava coleopterorum TaxID=2714937 RepID=A0A6G7Y715_9ACTN|nr:extracellular solute-binding protein [Propioniciclava coleopterorum]QIK72438.1 extracellular solute-binding protein [Propioniciclava coleopterorum]
MKFTKHVAAALLAAALAVTGAGCATPAGGPAGHKTLTFAIWDDLQEPAMKQIATAYEAKNPGVTVQVQLTPWDNYWDKMRTTVSAGNGPDVMWFTGIYFGLYASENQLAPLDGVDLSPYPESSTSMFNYQGKQYALPKDFDTVAMWYNKRLFEEAGLKAPGPGYTWAQMQQDAKTLSKGDVKGFAASSATQQNWYPAIYSAGGTVIDDAGDAAYNSPRRRRASAS